MSTKEKNDKTKFFGLYLNQKVMSDFPWASRKHVKPVDIEKPLGYLELRDTRAILKNI